MRRLLLLAIVSAACFGVVQVGVAHAINACGTISSSTTLSADCSGTLTVGASGITVDLGGHSVICSGAPGTFGIQVGGWSDVLVKNGSVTDCGTGVSADGGNFNQYVGLTVVNNSPPSKAVGIDIGNSVGSTIMRNEVTNNSTFNGINVFQTTGTLIQRNTVTNSGFGINENGGINNVIALNSASNNSFAGIALLGGATSNVVVRNSTLGNKTGIEVVGTASGNRLLANVSLQNADFDMQDDSANCDSNVWKANTFVTSNQSCIQ